MYKTGNMHELNISGILARYISDKQYNKITNPLLSLLTKILILDTENEEWAKLESECHFLANIKLLMDTFIENIEVVENYIDIIEVLFKKAHAGNFNDEHKNKIIEFGYQFFNYVFGLLEDRYESFAEKSLNILLYIAQNANSDAESGSLLKIGQPFFNGVKWCLKSDN